MGLASSQSTGVCGWPVYLQKKLLSIDACATQVCELHLLVLPLVHRSAVKKRKVITCNELRWRRVLKTMKSIHCSHHLLFRLRSTKFFPMVLPFLANSAVALFPVLAHMSRNQRFGRCIHTPYPAMCSENYTAVSAIGENVSPLSIQTETCTQTDTFAGP